jgi:hypothetical protein
LRKEEMLSIAALREASVKSSNELAIKAALAQYLNQMKNFFQLLRVWSDEAVNQNHERFKRSTLEYFRNLERSGNEEEKLKYERILIDKMEEIRVEVIRIKDIKVLLTTFGTLITGIGGGVYLVTLFGIETCVTGALALFNLFKRI